jgi:DNA-binding NarL/FixJ family response regulator
VLTAREAPSDIRRAFAAGASGYVAKSQLTEALLVAIRNVLRGEPYGTPGR